jgi:hypothetical protein
MLDLRRSVFRASRNMAEAFRNPFQGTVTATVPEDRKAFAKAMNFAIHRFMTAATSNVEMAEHLFTAYVEGEKIMRK